MTTDEKIPAYVNAHGEAVHLEDPAVAVRQEIKEAVSELRTALDVDWQAAHGAESMTGASTYHGRRTRRYWWGTAGEARELREMPPEGVYVEAMTRHFQGDVTGYQVLVSLCDARLGLNVAVCEEHESLAEATAAIREMAQELAAAPARLGELVRELTAVVVEER